MKKSNVVVVSPHRDDACFSLALAVDSWIAGGHRVEVVNIFTRSRYAPHANLASIAEVDRPSYVSALRRREDDQFVQALRGLTMLDIDVEDAPIRLKCDSSAVCDTDIPVDGPTLARIRMEFSIRWDDAQKRGCAFVLPLALGHHIDHRTARDAFLPLMAEVPCAFYEDLPYAAREGVCLDLAQLQQRIDASYRQQLSPVLCRGTQPNPVEWKRKQALLYASQIDAAEADRIACFLHRYQGGERLWANDAWISLAVWENLSVPAGTEPSLP